MSNVQFLSASFVNRKFIGKIQTAESVRVSVKQDIAEVLSLGLDSCVNSYEASVGGASFYGKTNIRLLYSDGTNLCSSNYNADFTSAIQSELLTADSKLTFDIATVDSKVDTNANTATITILLEISVYAYALESAPYFADGEDVFVKSDTVEVLENARVTSLPFTLDEELVSTRNISTALLAESNLCVTNYSVHDGILNISGSGVIRLTYLSDGDIVTDVLPFDFDRELEADGDMAESQLKVRAIPKTTKVRLDISEGDVNTMFTVEIGAVAIVDVTKIGALEIVTDAYGLDCDFDFERKNVITTLPCGSAVCNKHVVASVANETGKTPIAAVNVGAIVTNCQSRERSAIVEGIVYATLLYKDETGYSGEQLEVPFSQIVDVDYLMPQCRSSATVTVMDFTVSNTGGSALNVEIEMCITIESERDVSYNVIVNADERAFDKMQLPAIEVCLAHKGETLWSLAKSLHMSVEDLIAANPQLSNPVEEDARIVIYNKI